MYLVVIKMVKQLLTETKILKKINSIQHTDKTVILPTAKAAVRGVARSLTRLSDFTFTFHLSCVGEGNGNPLQCSCLENPRDGGAWWAAIYGVAQSRTRLKRLSSSSSAMHKQL